MNVTSCLVYSPRVGRPCEADERACRPGRPAATAGPGPALRARCAPRAGQYFTTDAWTGLESRPLASTGPAGRSHCRARTGRAGSARRLPVHILGAGARALDPPRLRTFCEPGGVYEMAGGA